MVTSMTSTLGNEDDEEDNQTDMENLPFPFLKKYNMKDSEHGTWMSLWGFQSES